MIYWEGEKAGAPSLGNDPKDASHWLSPFSFQTILNFTSGSKGLKAIVSE